MTSTFFVSLSVLHTRGMDATSCRSEIPRSVSSRMSEAILRLADEDIAASKWARDAIRQQMEAGRQRKDNMTEIRDFVIDLIAQEEKRTRM